MMYKPLSPFLERIWENFISFIRPIDYRTIVACIVISIALWPLILFGFIRPTKPVVEIASLVIMGLFLFGIVVRFAVTRDIFLLWAAGLMAIGLCREIHFTGSDEMLLIGWPILAVIVIWRYDLFKSYLMNPVLINLLVGGFLFYCTSQTVGQRWWKGLPGEEAVFVRLEETIELLGHCMVGIAFLFCKEVRPPDNPTSAVK